MTLNFIEIGDQCSHHYFTITSNNEVLLDDDITLKILYTSKIENTVNITTDKYYGEFGDYLSVKLNYFYLRLIVNTSSTTGDIEFGSKIVYGYNKENSHIDLLTQALINKDLYYKFEERFNKAYGEESGILPIFLNYVFNNTELDYVEKLSLLEELCLTQQPDPIEFPLIDCEFPVKYNWVIIRNTDKEPNLLDKLLIAILESKNQSVGYHYEKDITDLKRLDKNDIFIIINSEEKGKYYKPNRSFIVYCKDDFYKGSRKVLRMLSSILDWAKELQIPDRTISIEDLDGCGKGGSKEGCGNCSKEGGCGSKKRENQI